MTEDTIKISADNLRADFLNASTTWERWKVLNRALEWATAATENGDAYRKQAQEMQQKVGARDGERYLTYGDRTIRAGDIVTWEDEEEGWIVRRVTLEGLCEILPLGDDWALGTQKVRATDLLS